MAKAGFALNRLRRERGQDGVALVEFALVLPMLLLFLVGLTDLGRAVYYMNTMENAAREGARVGIVFQSASNWGVDGNQLKGYSSLQPYAGTNTVVGRVANFLSGMELDETSATLSAPLGTGRSQSLPFTVRVEYTYQPVTMFIGVPDIPLVVESTMRIE
jgi:Flp pilus assembly protein TadG